MCLIKDKKYHPFNRPLIAEEDIMCYKQLHLNCANILVTPHTKIPVPTKCVQKNKKKRIPFKAEILNKFEFIWRHVLGFSNIVTDGFIHSHAHLPGDSFLYYTFQCIIPKGTKYFIGNNDDYASKQIIFVKRVR